MTLAPLAVFGLIWMLFWLSRKGSAYFYFDPQDCFNFASEKRQFPLSAQKATFEPLLKHYIGVTQLLVTVAAASIAFGGDRSPLGVQRIVLAKLILAWSIFYGVLFCAFVLYRYDEYTQDVKSYTRWCYATVESLAFASLVCFVAGYLVWGWGLSKLS